MRISRVYLVSGLSKEKGDADAFKRLAEATPIRELHDEPLEKTSFSLANLRINAFNYEKEDQKWSETDA